LSEEFFERPIRNSPYAYPDRHWELDSDGQPTNRIIDTRRRSELITPVPKPKKRKKSKNQLAMVLDSGDDLSTEEQEYNPTPIINEIRTYIEAWRRLAAVLPPLDGAVLLPLDGAVLLPLDGGGSRRG